MYTKFYSRYLTDNKCRSCPSEMFAFHQSQFQRKKIVKESVKTDMTIYSLIYFLSKYGAQMGN